VVHGIKGFFDTQKSQDNAFTFFSLFSIIYLIVIKF